MRLSRHFVENWQTRVGNMPSEALVISIIQDAVPIQRCYDIPQTDGTIRRMLAVYWHPDLDLILKIDEIRRVAVTVLSRQNHETRRNRKAKKKIHHPDSRRPVEARAQ